MPSVDEYIGAAVNYDYDFINQIPDDPTMIDVPLNEFVWNACLLLSASKDNMFRYILEMYEDLNINDELHIANLIALDNRSDISIFRNLRLYYPELSIVELFSQWTSQSFSDSVALALDKLVKVYGIPDYPVLKEMLFILDTNQQFDFYNYIFEFASEISDFAPIPGHVNQDRIVTQQELDAKFEELIPKITLLDSDTLAKDIYDNIAPFGEEVSLERMERLISYASTKERNTLSNAISIMNKDNNNNHIAIPYFGPSNPIQFPLTDWDEHNIDMYVTTERMLLCDFYDHDENGEDVEWYTGSCDKCGLRIRKINHCVRMPVISGGWEGCFCSWKCTQDYVDTNYYDESEIINDLIELYAAQLNEQTIFDRE